MLSGTGIKVKVVEALAAGLPVVCTSRGMDGLPDKIRNGCLVSDEPFEFAKNITALLNDHELYNRQAEAAKDLIVNHFSKRVIYRELDKLFAE